MGRLIVIILFIFCFSSKFYSQTDSVYTGNKSTKVKQQREKKDYKWKEKITYGGNVQAVFGSWTYIYLSPTIGYNPVKKLNFGIGFIYNYLKSPYSRSSQSIYGGHSYARVFLRPNFFVQGQYDKLLQPNRYSINNSDKKIWVDYALAGIGYSQPVGERFALNTLLMYNLTPSLLSIYPSRFILQVGFVGRF